MKIASGPQNNKLEKRNLQRKDGEVATTSMTYLILSSKMKLQSHSTKLQ